MARPSAPTSAKPAVMTTRALTPRAAQSSTTPSTASRGTAMIGQVDRLREVTHGLDTRGSSRPRRPLG